MEERIRARDDLKRGVGGDKNATSSSRAHKP